MTSCYMCDAPGTTREHVPPRAFFPPGHRSNLWTVPSCSLHNHRNSLDVEYARSVLALDAATNDIARQVVRGSVFRSWQRRPSLQSRTFRRWRRTTLAGRRTGIVETEVPRIDNVVSAVASAIFFREFASPFRGSWMVYLSGFVSPYEGPGREDPLNARLRRALEQIAFDEQSTPHPCVFRYARYAGSGENLIYRCMFYEGNGVFAISMPPSVDPSLSSG